MVRCHSVTVLWRCLFLNKVLCMQSEQVRADSFQPLFFNICLSIRKKLTRPTGKSWRPLLRRLTLLLRTLTSGGYCWLFILFSLTSYCFGWLASFPGASPRPWKTLGRGACPAAGGRQPRELSARLPVSQPISVQDTAWSVPDIRDHCFQFFSTYVVFALWKKPCSHATLSHLHAYTQHH